MPTNPARRKLAAAGVAIDLSKTRRDAAARDQGSVGHAFPALHRRHVQAAALELLPERLGGPPPRGRGHGVRDAAWTDERGPTGFPRREGRDVRARGGERRDGGGCEREGGRDSAVFQRAADRDRELPHRDGDRRGQPRRRGPHRRHRPRERPRRGDPEPLPRGQDRAPRRDHGAEGLQPRGRVQVHDVEAARTAEDGHDREAVHGAVHRHGARVCVLHPDGRRVRTPLLRAQSLGEPGRGGDPPPHHLLCRRLVELLGGPGLLLGGHRLRRPTHRRRGGPGRPRRAVVLPEPHVQHGLLRRRLGDRRPRHHLHADAPDLLLLLAVVHHPRLRQLGPRLAHPQGGQPQGRRHLRRVGARDAAVHAQPRRVPRHVRRRGAAARVRGVAGRFDGGGVPAGVLEPRSARGPVRQPRVGDGQRVQRDAVRVRAQLRRRVEGDTVVPAARGRAGVRPGRDRVLHRGSLLQQAAGNAAADPADAQEQGAGRGGEGGRGAGAGDGPDDGRQDRGLHHLCARVQRQPRVGLRHLLPTALARRFPQEVPPLHLQLARRRASHVPAGADDDRVRGVPRRLCGVHPRLGQRGLRPFHPDWPLDGRPHARGHNTPIPHPIPPPPGLRPPPTLHRAPNPLRTGPAERGSPLRRLQVGALPHHPPVLRQHRRLLGRQRRPPRHRRNGGLALPRALGHRPAVQGPGQARPRAVRRGPRGHHARPRRHPAAPAQVPGPGRARHDVFAEQRAGDAAHVLWDREERGGRSLRRDRRAQACQGPDEQADAPGRQRVCVPDGARVLQILGSDRRPWAGYAVP